ncbi:hypothetical protein [Lyngbya sp. CCY1209]|jgi:hypothetical protein|uniref:hypothetical protein n=1 Tax=Lyngbya sp. CCY1209 TaxID=2886103 RepID=UPI002D20DB01|nr:hypothetical protein [Lyngbya sp. CCY1209]MEB3882360.1 hypothetical protein [Lyngbya sp. CCY1209]
MICIRDVVQNAIATGFLSLEAENQLRQMLKTTQNDGDALDAFANLQVAAMTGKVRQESREMFQSR